MNKKLYKSKTDKKICGVCGGLAEYLETDVTIIRLFAALSIFFVGGGLLVYILGAIVIPFKPEA